MKKLKKLKYLLEGSDNSNNSGYTPNIPKYEKTYIEDATSEIIITTDLAERIYNRNCNLNRFFNKYRSLTFKTKTVTVLCAIIDQVHCPKIDNYIKNLKRMLERKEIQVLGYVWQRDVGDNRFEKHYHLLIATTRMDLKISTQIELYGSINPDRFRIELMKTKGGMQKYLRKKEIFSARYQKGFSKSQCFKSP